MEFLMEMPYSCGTWCFILLKAESVWNLLLRMHSDCGISGIFFFSFIKSKPSMASKIKLSLSQFPQVLMIIQNNNFGVSSSNTEDFRDWLWISKKKKIKKFKKQYLWFIFWEIKMTCEWPVTHQATRIAPTFCTKQKNHYPGAVTGRNEVQFKVHLKENAQGSVEASHCQWRAHEWQMDLAIAAMNCIIQSCCCLMYFRIEQNISSDITFFFS